MPEKNISQRTLASAARTIREFKNSFLKVEKREPSFTELLYQRDFPDWFVQQANVEYHWNWIKIFMDLRNGHFFYHQYTHGNITGKRATAEELLALGEACIRTLAAFATTLHGGDEVERNLELDGYGVNKDTLALIPLDGAVSATEEEDTLTRLVKDSGVPDVAVVVKHIEDANSPYADGMNHASLNESRNLIQALVDGISTETNKHAQHSTTLPGAMANRMDYLATVGFLTDEKAALGSAWGTLSAGSHPGVPERDQARIGLILALEFGQLLLLKFTNWKANGYRSFSRP